MRPTPRAAVNLWTAGFATSALIQGLFARRFAAGKGWGHNGGWQREIAIWNLGTLTTIAALRRDPADVDGGLLRGFAVLSALFGANHLVAAGRSPRSLGNWVGAAANATALAAALPILAGESSAAG